MSQVGEASSAEQKGAKRSHRAHFSHFSIPRTASVLGLVPFFRGLGRRLAMVKVWVSARLHTARIYISHVRLARPELVHRPCCTATDQ